MENPFDKPEQTNPYQAPEAALIDESNEPASQVLLDPPKLPSGAGVQWFSTAWELFKASPGVWIGMTVVFVIIIIVLSIIPLVSLIVTIITPVFMAGFIVAAHEQDKGTGVWFSHLFEGFQRNTGQLFLVGLLYMAAFTVAFIPGVVVMLLGGGLPLIMAEGNPSNIMTTSIVLGILLGFLVMMACFIPVLMAYWFAPALVVLNDMEAIPAMKLSFKACLRNMLPFLIYGLVGLALSIPIVLTLGLAYIVIGPVLMISYYTSYKSVLIDGE